jgi:ubiquitin-conjugating enzyme E2 N
MSAPLPKRIIKETERLQNEPVPGISAQPHDDNARYFDVIVEGPGGSCYEGEMECDLREALCWR